ncbi:hypothetical protein FO440_10665 [Mucilaginibacter corticis]|uniref:Uncharacterized protein n=1 Tax=Mucilaginibacter corticis TaxID=2597670 RepID=A0A556MK20_9SPHI|nr:hypothetical protein [Mucilaginibacter corticis]TSJ40222.1 hypothetical protein FO440_10665 [Mucilaginibacter corticis]
MSIGNHNKRKLEFLIGRKKEIEKEYFVMPAADSERELQKFNDPIILTNKFSFQELAGIFLELLNKNKIKTTSGNLLQVLLFISSDASGKVLTEADLIEICDNYQITIDFNQILRLSFSEGKTPIYFSNISINYVPTIFYELKEKGKIQCSDQNLIRILIDNFRDNKGNVLKENTLKDIFNKSKPNARSKKVQF